MALTLKSLDEQVIVITGASSGIGLATARSAAKKGAKVVLAARSEESLADISRQIQSSGGQAAAVAADVSDRNALNHVAEVAIDRFGGFDTWVNNAGVGLYGRLEETPEEDARKLFDTNFWGAVHGSLVAAEHLRKRGGAIINVGSVASDNAIPLLGMYSASKHALRAFTDALRMELDLEKAPISVTLIKPTSINTPFPHHARNYTDREPDVPPPVYEPDDVAYAILHACTHPERDIYVGSAARLMSSLGKHMPRTNDWITEKVMVPRELRDEPPRQPRGALDRGRGEGEVYGDHPGFVHPVSVYTRASLHPLLATGLMAVSFGLTAAAAILVSREIDSMPALSNKNGKLKSSRRRVAK
jgi:short-subunit dehydrogenase